MPQFETYPIVILACLIIGWVIKNLIVGLNTRIDDTYKRFIPLILAVVGALLGALYKHSFELEVLVYGAISGLISTGLHQLFSQIINGGGKVKNDTNQQ